MRGATSATIIPRRRSSYFNPRSPCGERPAPGASAPRNAPYFNPRSPCGERHVLLLSFCDDFLFQPTLPVRGATRHAGGVQPRQPISTHAPRAGSDGYPTRLHHQYHHHFNPRSPCGERLQEKLKTTTCLLFQPTLPVRGATHNIMALPHDGQYFNPRSPCGERPITANLYYYDTSISTHAPRAGSDLLAFPPHH